MLHKILWHLPFYTITLFFIFIGLYVFIRRQPLLINYRWFFFFLILIFITPVVVHADNLFEPFNLIMIFFFLLFTAYMYYMMRGIMIIGADGDDFQRNFVDVLRESNYEFEQTMTSVKIKEPAIEISVAFQSWIGSGTVRMRTKEHKAAFNNIISVLRNKKIKPNLFIPLIYLAFGVLMFLMELKSQRLI